jgi:hypothetical protein
VLRGVLERALCASPGFVGTGGIHGGDDGCDSTQVDLQVQRRDGFAIAGNDSKIGHHWQIVEHRPCQLVAAATTLYLNGHRTRVIRPRVDADTGYVACRASMLTWRTVILVLTEDDWSTVVRPRLEVAEVDLNRVHVVAVERDGSGAPTFPDHMDVLTSTEITPALVVVDAWLDTVPPKLSVRDPQQARQALHPWKEYATTIGAAVLLLTNRNRVATPNARAG